ncbi:MULTISPECIES: ABC transporter substrate-binding protein [unclassified Beijerinckia]|uniref:ABC transporter substrate-binding protein n=1 Tax=unclassified Beijerinckia TaxID=2638183 RepID=UPI001FCDE38F|nr:MULTISPECIES: ABC transporter substrate-binding protein [unclassified Beijerinckia]
MDRRTFTGGLLLASCLGARPAFAADKLLYLFPTIPTLPAFAPFQVAKAKGFFAAENLDVTFQAAKGGVDGAKQVGAGNADLAGGIGDTPIILRPNGIPVRAVALLGGHALHQLIVRKDAGIRSFADLKGKQIGVVSYQDTSFYNLLGVLASVGLDKNSANIQAVGPTGITALMASGNLQAIVGAPEWAVTLENNAVAIETFQIDSAFPAMAQALLASDATIKARPDLVRRFVSAVLKGVAAVAANPQESAATYLKEIDRPDSELPSIAKILTFYAQKVYPAANGFPLGQFDPTRVAKVQDFYLANGLIEKATPVADLFTNQFVGG